MPRPKLTDRPHRSAKLLTTAAVAAIGITGAAAIGVNLGILSNASDSELGKLTAASATSTAVAAPATTTPVPTSIAAAGTQRFAIDVAGTATVTGTPGAVHLDGVVPAEGWRWELGQTGNDALKVTFTNGTRTLVFAAQAKADGSVSAGVSEPAPRTAPTTGQWAAPTPPATAAVPAGGVVATETAPPVTLRPPTTLPRPVEHESEHEYEGGEDDD